MSNLAQMLNHPFVETLGWSLIHFLWQGILIAILAAVVLAMLKNASASLRYFVACLAFVLMASSPAVTIWTLNSDRAIANGTAANHSEENSELARPSGTGSVVTTGDLTTTLPQTPNELPEHPAGGPLTTATANESSAGTLEPWLTTLVAGWLFGVTALSLRLVLTLLQVSRLRIQVTSIDPQEMTNRLAELTRRLGVSRPVRLAQSALVEVPTVIGALKPLILLPATAMTGLTAEQLDAILAHEIAHIRRHDYLVNLVQTVIETLLFYHPGVWWLSGRIRQERENCCDDIASDLCENPIRYAEALVRMEELRTPAGGLALAATGGSLKTRIRRLLGQTSHESSTSWWVGGLVSLLIVFGLVVTLSSLSSQSQAEEPVPPETTEASADAQLPADKEEPQGEVKPLTPAAIADAMEESMKQFATVDVSGELLNDAEAVPDEVEGTFRFQSKGQRFHANQICPIPGKGITFLEGFDGKTHYCANPMLTLGEESGSGQAISPMSLLFSLNGRPTDVPRRLRYENAKIVDESIIDGIKCLVIESSYANGSQIWTYQMTVAPGHSWLPLVLTSSINGEVTTRKTLRQIEKINDVWIARKITTERFNKSEVTKTRRIRITEFSANPQFGDEVFDPPIKLGTNVMDRRVGYGWYEGPWWSELKPWLQNKYGWPRPDLFELRSMQHVGPKSKREGRPAPPIDPAEWLTSQPGSWDRPERKLTLLYFYGGRLISPTPKWARAINELHRRYRKYGFEVIGLATATDSPELTRQAATEMNLGFPVAIDQKSGKGYGKTFTAYDLQYYYHGLFFVDHEGIVQTVKQGEPSKVTVDGQEFTISHIEAKVIDLLKEAGVDNVKPQVMPDDIFDIKTHNEVLAKWRSLRADAPKDASVHGRVTFNGAPIAGASIKLQPSMRIMSSNTGHGFMLFPDRQATITVPTNLDGTYEIANLTKGEYKFTCSAKGLKTRNRTILIGADLPKVNVDVALSKE